MNFSKQRLFQNSPMLFWLLLLLLLFIRDIDGFMVWHFVFLLGNPAEQQQTKSVLPMENRELLTAFSDLVLCAASIWSVQLSSTAVNERNLLSSVGFGVLAIASGLGCIRFSVLIPRYHSSVIKCHLYFAFLGSSVGLPLLAATYCMQTRYQVIRNVFVILAIGGPLLDAFGIFKQNSVKEISSTLSILAILTISLFLTKFGTNSNGIIGGLAFVVGGLAIGTKGRGLLGLNNVDWFHYVLATGTVALARGTRSGSLSLDI